MMAQGSRPIRAAYTDETAPWIGADPIDPVDPARDLP